VVPVHISYVLADVAMHHVCSAGRPSTLGQQSAPNLGSYAVVPVHISHKV